MRKAQGYGVTFHEDGSSSEEDSFTCCHCNMVCFVKPGHAVAADDGGFCRMCMRNICGPCADKGECTPFEKKLEQMESRDRLFKAATGG